MRRGDCLDCGLFGALFCALFFWLEPLCGPAFAAAIVAMVAIVLGLIASLPKLSTGRP